MGIITNTSSSCCGWYRDNTCLALCVGMQSWCPILLGASNDRQKMKHALYSQFSPCPQLAWQPSKGAEKRTVEGDWGHPQIKTETPSSVLLGMCGCGSGNVGWMEEMLSCMFLCTICLYYIHSSILICLYVSFIIVKMDHLPFYLYYHFLKSEYTKNWK